MRLFCWHCKKSVSTELPGDTVLRATATCPECEEERGSLEDAARASLRIQMGLAELALEQDKGYMTRKLWYELKAAIEAAKDIKL